jgi:hypothetical protein
MSWMMVEVLESHSRNVSEAMGFASAQPILQATGLQEALIILPFGSEIVDMVGVSGINLIGVSRLQKADFIIRPFVSPLRRAPKR